MSLQASKSTQITDRTLFALAEKASQLSYLDISTCRQLTDAGLTAVARGCRLLQTVSVKHCYRLTDASLVPLVQGTGLHLRVLIAKDCRGITDAVLKAVAESCTQVRFKVSLFLCGADIFFLADIAGRLQLQPHHRRRCKAARIALPHAAIHLALRLLRRFAQYGSISFVRFSRSLTLLLATEKQFPASCKVTTKWARLDR